MGNGIGKCFIRHEDISPYITCFHFSMFKAIHAAHIPPPKTVVSDQPTTHSTAVATFRTISGASISANTSTPLSTTLLDIGTYGVNGDKASTFQSSNLFSSIPLVRSGPIHGVSGNGSGPIERGFMSGPIERSFVSGPLENNNQFDQFQRYKPKCKKWGTFGPILKKLLSQSHVLSSKVELCMRATSILNVRGLKGKLGRIEFLYWRSEGMGGVLLNLYSNLHKELKGLLWTDNKADLFDNSLSNQFT
ncbi:hypothetical protein Leryth_018166 [Lithospermum erythrorhizon]|nr:hypothetical protein Leryth_018166 [Lithospermum erythrorhizon]